MRPSPDIPAFNRHNFSAIEQAWKKITRDQFSGAVQPGDRMYSAFTTKDAKAQGAAEFVAHVFRERMQRPIDTMIPEGEEPKMEWSGDVALAKARDGKRKLHIEVPLELHPAVLAADVNVYIKGEPSHKLERIAQQYGGELPAEIWLQEYTKLMQIFAGNVPFEILWEPAIACVDGAEAVASYRGSLVVEPLDPRIMRAALEQARQNCLYLFSNTGFATIETILDHGNITDMSVVPFVLGRTERTRQEDARWRRAGDRALLQLLARDIITTAPNLLWSL